MFPYICCVLPQVADLNFYDVNVSKHRVFIFLKKFFYEIKSNKNAEKNNWVKKKMK